MALIGNSRTIFVYLLRHDLKPDNSEKKDQQIYCQFLSRNNFNLITQVTQPFISDITTIYFH